MSTVLLMYRTNAMNERKADKLKMVTDHLFSSFFIIGLNSGACCVPDGSPHSWLDYKKQWSCLHNTVSWCGLGVRR